MIVTGRRTARWTNAWLDGVSGAVSLLWVLPLITALLTAIKPTAEIYAAHFTWLTTHPTFSHFIEAWRLAPFGRYYLNSLTVAASATVVTLLISSMAAYALARVPFFGRSILFGGILATTMVPFQVLLIPFFILLTALRLVNSLGGLVIAYVTILLPFAIFMLTGFMRHLPREVEESARIDGCSWVGIWWRIALPMSRPALAAVGIYAFIESWREFFVALVMTNSQSMRTVPVGLALFRVDTPGVSWGEIMASALTAAVPALLVFLLLQRQFISGLTEGAVKG
jgi:ABC-type glycerol-3-phosphate transport system permease component